MRTPPRLFLAASLIILVIILSCSAAYCAYVVDAPITITQPDGSTVDCLTTGDEYYHWVHDSNGYVMVQSQDTGWWMYAELVDGDVVASKYVVGQVDPVEVGLTPNIKPSVQKVQTAQKTLFSVPMEVAPQPSPTTGAINNIVVFVRFSDDSEFTDSKSSYENVFNSSATGANSLRNYFYEASYNTLTVLSTFYPTTTGTTVVSYQDSHPRAYYQPYNATTNTIGYDNDGGDREQQMFANAINAIKSQVPTSLNIDADNDGVVDDVCFIIKGAPNGWGDTLWPHQWWLYKQSASINGKSVGPYNMQFTSWVMPNGVGVLAHEMLHVLGCPDLYHYTSGTADPIGAWDVMCSNGNPPQHPGAYLKYHCLHWLPEPATISSSGVYTLNPLTSSNQACYKIASPNSSSEFFVVEYRRKTGTFESSVPGTGLMVYRINPAANGNGDGPPDEVWAYRPNGTSTITGDLGNACFGFTTGRTAIDDTTNPACTLYSGKPGGLRISNIGSVGWLPESGAWSTTSGVLQQTSSNDNCRNVYYSPTWTDYTFTCRACKTGGAEGFLIMFGVANSSNYYWWNIGGWGNTKTTLEKCVNGSRGSVGTSTTDKVTSNAWYDIKIVVQGTTIRCYLNNVLKHTFTDPSIIHGGIGLATWTTQAQYDDVKVVDGNGVTLYQTDFANYNNEVAGNTISFTLLPTITASAGTDGTISPSGVVPVNSGTDQIFTITPDAGYSVDNVIVDGVSKGAVTSYTFTNVTASHTISATFLLAGTSRLTGSVIGTTGSYDGSSTRDKVFDRNTSTYFDAPAPGVDAWAGLNLGVQKIISKIRFYPRAGFESRMNGCKFQGSNSANFSTGVVDLYTIPSVPPAGWNDVPITVTTPFRYVRYLSVGANYGNVAEVEFYGRNAYFTITATAGANGSISPSGAVSVGYGTSKIFALAPSAGYGIVKLIVDGASKVPVNSYTFTNVTANHTISATFDKIIGMNNRTVQTDSKVVGKVIKIWGKVKSINGTTSFTIDDGYGVPVTVNINGVTLPVAFDTTNTAVVVGVLSVDKSVQAQSVVVYP